MDKEERKNKMKKMIQKLAIQYYLFFSSTTNYSSFDGKMLAELNKDVLKFDN